MNKMIYIIIGIVLLLIISFVLYKFVFTKQNFQNLNNKKMFKIESKVFRNLKSKIEEERKLIKEKVNKTINSPKKLRALNKMRSLEDTSGQELNPEYLPPQFVKSINDSNIGKLYYLPDCNLLEPDQFVKTPGIRIFKEDLPVGKLNSSQGVRNIVKTISAENELIKKIISSDNKIQGNFSFMKDSDQIVKTLSNEISGSVGGTYGKVSVNATFKYLTKETSTSKREFQGYNISILKNSGTFYMDPEMWYKEEYYSQTFLDDFIKLAEKDFSQDPELYKNFYQKYGSHILYSISLGKKVDSWDTIESTSTENTNLLLMQACLSVSYGGYSTCVVTEECTENYEEGDIDWDNFDWDKPVNWEPVPVPGTENLYPETTRSTKEETTQPSITTTTQSPTTTTTTTTTQPPAPRCRKVDSCSGGETCKGYVPAKKDPDTGMMISETKGQCVPAGKSVGFSIGVEVCASRTESTKENSFTQNTENKIIVYGGSNKNQADLVTSKLAGGATVLDKNAIMNFLSDNGENDVPIDFKFKSIWDIFKIIYYDLCKDKSENYMNRYKIAKIKYGCKRRIQRNSNFATQTIESSKKYLKIDPQTNQPYPTDIYFTATSFPLSYFNDNSVKYTEVPVMISFQSSNETIDGKSYIVFNINQLIPKIILGNPDATIEDYPDAQVKGKSFFILINKNDQNDIQLDIRNSDSQQNGEAEFNIFDFGPYNNNFLTTENDKTYLNFKLIFSAKLEKYDINYVRTEYTFQNVLTYEKYSMQSLLIYNIICDTNDFNKARNYSDYVWCTRIEEKVNVSGKEYYNYTYFDENLNKNIIELYVPEIAVSKYYDPCKMYKAAQNLEIAYVYNIECPKFEILDELPNTSGIEGGVITPIVCDKSYVVGGASYGADGNLTGMNIKCSDGTTKSFGKPYNGGQNFETPEGVQKVVVNANDYVRGITYYKTKDIPYTIPFGNFSGTSKDLECPEGSKLAGFKTWYDGTYVRGIKGICKKYPPCVGDICCFDKIGNNYPKNKIWAITGVMGGNHECWDQRAIDLKKDGWIPCQTNVPTQPGLDVGRIDLNHDIRGPNAGLYVKYQLVDINSDTPILTNIRTGPSNPDRMTKCPGHGFQMLEGCTYGHPVDAAIISQTHGTKGDCEDYQAGCSYYTPAKDATDYVNSIAVTETRNNGSITNLRVKLPDSDAEFTLNNVGSDTDLHVGCGDDYAQYIVFSLNKIKRT